MLDMPLEKLYEYKGLNPRPADFDEFWDKALTELASVDPQAKFIPADFSVPNAKCYDVYFTGVGGARVHAKYVRPEKVAGPIPCVLMFHGYSGNAGAWHDKLAYTAVGMAVMAIDARGQGGLSEDIEPRLGTTLRGHIIRGLDDSPEKLAFRSIFLDCVQMGKVASALPEIDETRLGATGGSQGGGLTVACSALLPSVKALAPSCPFLSDYKRVWEMDLAKDAYEELKAFFRNHDPRHLRETEIFTRLGYIDIQNLAPRIKGKVLWAVGLMDNICPPSTQFAAYNKITAPKELAIYPDFAHEGYPGFGDMTMEFFVKNL
jgi:cephalosporin-C deacetylase